MRSPSTTMKSRPLLMTTRESLSKKKKKKHQKTKTPQKTQPIKKPQTNEKPKPLLFRSLEELLVKGLSD